MIRKLIFSFLAIAAVASTEASTHRLATYNIRYTGASTDTDGKDWGQRGPVCRDVILNYDFDIVGFQEVTGAGRSYRNPLTNRTQLEDLRAWLLDYELIAWDRDGTKQQEYVAIAYKTDKYDLLDQGSFFISSTPDQTSNGWDTYIESHPRRVGWLKLQDKSTGEQFIYACTHTNDGWSLDGSYGSQVVASRIKEIAGDLPVMLVADFNTSRIDRDRKGLKAYQAAFHDAALEVPSDKNYSLPVTNRSADWTYNAFYPVSDMSYTGKEVDMQFYRGMNILERHIVTEEFTYNGEQYPSSDHFPVYVVAELSPVSKKTLYVDASSGSGNGSVSSPFSTISEAVAVADIDDTILVAAGEYNESISPKYSITIEGGYTAGFSKKDGITTISGTGLSTPPVYADSNIDLTLRNLTISGYQSPDNTLDGAILFRGSSLTMEDLIMEDNIAKDYGGALNIYNITTTKYCECNNIKATNCILRNNTSNYGGAWAVGFYDTMDIDCCSFENNTANKSAGAIYLTFGTPESSRIWFTEAKALITNSSFTGNSSKGSGTFYINDEMPNVQITISNTTFAGNQINAGSGLANVIKGYGGTAIHAKLTNKPSDSQLSKVNNSRLYLGHVSVVGNHAVCVAPANFKASALNVDSGDLKLINSIVAANTTNGTDAQGDVCLGTSTSLVKETHNVFSTTVTVNFSIDNDSHTATSAEEAASYIAAMMDGEIQQNKYIPAISTIEGATPFVNLKSTLFGTEDLAYLTVLQRNLELEFNTDIDRDGTVGTQTKTDQLGRDRNSKSMPGAIEYLPEESSVSEIVTGDSGVTFRNCGNGEIRITSDSAIGPANVFDADGNILFSQDIRDCEYILDLSNFNRGIFIIKCKDSYCKILL